MAQQRPFVTIGSLELISTAHFLTPKESGNQVHFEYKNVWVDFDFTFLQMDSGEKRAGISQVALGFPNCPPAEHPQHIYLIQVHNVDQLGIFTSIPCELLPIENYRTYLMFSVKKPESKSAFYEVTCCFYAEARVIQG